MKKTVAIFLQIVVALIGIGALAFMLWEPHLEGRNVNATLFEIYFNDPFLAYAYVASISFFVGLYQVFKALGYVGQGNMFSQETLKALRSVKHCARVLAFLIAVPVTYLFIVRPGDDIAGGVAVGLVLIHVSVLVAIVAARFEKFLQNALGLKSKKI